MNLRRATFTLLVLLLGATLSGSALADHGHFHGRVGVFIGAPLFWPGYYPGPYYYPYYYPPVVAVPSAPSQYIERGEGQAAPQQQSGYWYHCSNPEGYYPYVKECPGGWEQVTPQPSPPA
jgi:hypothetical protein